jgi:hypothetical protein
MYHHITSPNITTDHNRSHSITSHYITSHSLRSHHIPLTLLNISKKHVTSFKILHVWNRTYYSEDTSCWRGLAHCHGAANACKLFVKKMLRNAENYISAFLNIFFTKSKIHAFAAPWQCANPRQHDVSSNNMCDCKREELKCIMCPQVSKRNHCIVLRKARQGKRRARQDKTNQEIVRQDDTS